MKKILFLLSIIYFIFCWNIRRSITAEAISIESYELYCEDRAFDSNDFICLDAGFYLISSTNQIMSEQYFKGDIKYYEIQQDPATLSVENILNMMKISSENQSQYSTIFQNLLNEFKNISQPFRYKGYILQVNSQAVFYPKEDISEVYAVWAKTKKEYQNIQLAGHKTHIINVSQPKSLEDIQKKYSVTDNAEIIEPLSFYSNYTLDNLHVGTYFILVTAIDSAQNQTSAVDIISVVDFDCPIITLSQEEIIIDVGSSYDIKDAESYFNIEDNYTPTSKIRKQWDYPQNFSTNQIGQYRLGLTAFDSSNNESEKKEIILHVKDRIPPTIKIKNNMDRIITNKELTNNEILSFLEVEDNYDTTISVDDIEIIENTCSGKAGQIYNIKVKVQDQSGNPTIIDIPYDYRDTIAPIIYVTDVLYLDPTKEYTPKEILALLEEAGIKL